MNLFRDNQGDLVSPNIFRKPLSNMKTFLDKQHGIVINEQEILVRMLWADDLILIADSVYLIV